MVKMQFKLICFLSVVVNVILAQGIVFENDTTSWKTILEKAKNEHKLIFDDAVTSWCRPCKEMAKEVFPIKEVGDIYNKNFVNIKMDMEKDNNKIFIKKYAIEIYPTYLFINAENELVHKGTSLMKVDTLIALANTAIDPKKQFVTLKNKFNNGNCSPDFLKEFSYLCLDAADDKLAIEASTAYLKTQKDWLSKENMVFIKDFATWIENPAYGFVLKNKEIFKKEFGWRLIAKLEDYLPASNSFRHFFDRSKQLFDFPNVEAYLNKYLPKEIAEKTLSRVKIWQYQAQKDTMNTLKATVLFFDTYSISDSRLFSRFADVFYNQATDNQQLEKALEWSLKYVALENNY